MAATAPLEERLHEQYEDLDQQRQSYNAGFWVFLASEVMFFGVLFLSYAICRIWFADAFRVVGQEPDQKMGTLNTLVLLTSSLTMALAVRAAKLRREFPMLLLLLATAVLGSVFLGIKFYEWWVDIQHYHLPGAAFQWTKPGATPREAEMFFFLYFAMTGVHALHLSIGVLVVLGTIVMYLLGHPSVRRAASPVEMLGLYWHFVDIVWVFLYPMFYLIPPLR